MELTAHPAAQRGIDELVLADPRQAAELRRDDAGRIMVAVSRQILDRHARIGERRFDQSLDLAGGHGHVRDSPSCRTRYGFRAWRCQTSRRLTASPPNPH